MLWIRLECLPCSTLWIFFSGGTVFWYKIFIPPAHGVNDAFSLSDWMFAVMAASLEWIFASLKFQLKAIFKKKGGEKGRGEGVTNHRHLRERYSKPYCTRSCWLAADRVHAFCSNSPRRSRIFIFALLMFKHPKAARSFTQSVCKELGIHSEGVWRLTSEEQDLTCI